MKKETFLEKGLFYKIRRITVLPGKKLSYQLHHHRKSSHWVVVRGTAKVTIEGEEMLVRSGESTFVQSGKKHRLENPDKALLEVIEVQLGEYLEELEGAIEEKKKRRKESAGDI